MAGIQLNPYLNFDGNTREAMEFYRDVLGGELRMMTFGDMPGLPLPPDYKNKIMHANLQGGELALMASDLPPGKKPVKGDNVSLSLSGTDKERLSTMFQKLSAGGEVVMPLERQVWGDMFGMLKDKFGMQWMVNISVPQ